MVTLRIIRKFQDFFHDLVFYLYTVLVSEIFYDKKIDKENVLIIFRH